MTNRTESSHVQLCSDKALAPQAHRAAPCQGCTTTAQEPEGDEGGWSLGKQIRSGFESSPANSWIRCSVQAGLLLLENQHLPLPRSRSLDCPLAPRKVQPGWPALGNHRILDSMGLTGTERSVCSLLLELPALHLLCWALSRQSIHRWICPIKSMVWKDKHELPLICLFLLLVSPLPQLANLPLLFIQPSTYSIWKTPD